MSDENDRKRRLSETLAWPVFKKGSLVRVGPVVFEVVKSRVVPPRLVLTPHSFVSDHVKKEERRIITL